VISLVLLRAIIINFGNFKLNTQVKKGVRIAREIIKCTNAKVLSLSGGSHVITAGIAAVNDRRNTAP